MEAPTTMVKKLVPVIVAVVALAGAYKFVIAKPPAKAEPKPKVHGSVYMLEKEFLVNLHDGRFAKLQVGLVLAHDDHSTAPAGGGHGAAPTPPEGYGAMAQEGVVRDVITDVLTDAHDKELIEAKGRHHLKEEILKDLKKHTDVKVEHVLFSDVTVQ
jgi:flagellar basal body-associated protein FliL